jgi:hypothetical protein
MRWPRERIERLARVIAERIPLDVLSEVVKQYDIIKDFDTLLKGGPQDPAEKAYSLALHVVIVHDEAELAARFAKTLYFRLWQDAAAGPALGPFATDDDATQQASHVKRAATLSEEKLARFLEETRPRICLICALARIGGEESFSRGTGFLVGPDLVITARHVLRDHIRGDAQLNPSPGRVGAYFDHFEGDPIEDFAVKGVPPLFVEFADKWLMATSDEMVEDGMFRDPTDTQLDELTKHLDMVLVKLAEPVGRYTRSATGGARRLWFDIPDDEVSAGLREDDRVIIRQHPHGHPLRIDFGRLKEIDKSKTRIRYTTETDQGTSGAPCFNQHFKLIGMHNADYRPDGTTSVLNQAIRFDHIAKKVRDKLKRFDVPSSVGIWNASTSIESPVAILGRTTFLDWIGRSSAALPDNRADRLFAAIATRKGSGRTFSVDILRAARRSLLDRIVVLGTDTDAVPSSVSDFLAAVANQLRIPLTELAGLPPRPSSDLPATSGSGDKLYKWASEEVPRWFSDVLHKQREYKVDRVEESKKLVKTYEELGRVPPSDDVALAQRADHLIEIRYRWERIWIVIDRLSEEQQSDQVRLSEEVRNLIAGLTGGRVDEEAVPGELRRLRWIFLGQRPDFLLASQICSEDLDPSAVGLDDMIACIGVLANTFNKPLAEDAIKALRASFKLWMRDPAVQLKLEGTSERLETLQGQIAKLAPVLAEEYRGDHEPG